MGTVDDLGVLGLESIGGKELMFDGRSKESCMRENASWISTATLRRSARASFKRDRHGILGRSAVMAVPLGLLTPC